MNHVRRYTPPLAGAALLAAALCAPAARADQNQQDIAAQFGNALHRPDVLVQKETRAAVASALADARTASKPYQTFLDWHVVALDLTSLDHYALGGSGPQFDNYGPPATSRALAMAQLALYEVADAFAPAAVHTTSWLAPKLGGQTWPDKGANESDALNGAGYTILTLLYPDHVITLPGQGSQHLLAIAMQGAAPHTPSYAFGVWVANQIFALRKYDICMQPASGATCTTLNDTPATPVPPNPDLADGSFTAKPGTPGYSAPNPNIVPAWVMDPVSQIGTKLGAFWGKVPTFSGLNPAAADYSLPNPPQLGSAAYNASLQQVARVGSDTVHVEPPQYRRVDTPGHDTYYHAKFWAYDATPGLCAPVRLYNEIADVIMRQHPQRLGADLTAQIAGKHADQAAATQEAARYLALVNVAMADAAIVAWNEKYAFQLARPVTAIRADQVAKATQGTALGVANIVAWTPLGAQLTNSSRGYNITPPFPSYPSGHAVFGGALFQTIRLAVGSDPSFSFWSDEFNGPNTFRYSKALPYPNIDAYNYARCDKQSQQPTPNPNVSAKYCNSVGFSSLTAAEVDNALSRVWMGVHWNFDASCGDSLGENVGTYVFANALRPDHGGPSAPAPQPLAGCADQHLTSPLMPS